MTDDAVMKELKEILEEMKKYAQAVGDFEYEADGLLCRAFRQLYCTVPEKYYSICKNILTTYEDAQGWYS